MAVIPMGLEHHHSGVSAAMAMTVIELCVLVEHPKRTNLARGLSLVSFSPGAAATTYMYRYHNHLGKSIHWFCGQLGHCCSSYGLQHKYVLIIHLGEHAL